VSSQNEFDDDQPTVVAKAGVDYSQLLQSRNLPLSPLENMRMKFIVWWMKWESVAETMTAALSMTVTSVFRWLLPFLGEK